jgi:HEAT repeat protein
LVAAVAAGGELAAPAADSLRVIYGPGIDEAIVTALKHADGGLQATLIDVLESRRATCAVPFLLEQAADPEATIRSRAIRALGSVAQPDALPAMIDLLLRTPKGQERDDLEKAIVLVAGRANDPGQQSAPVLARLSRADDAQSIILLPLVGRIGGKAALATVQQSLNNGNAEIHDAALRALCNWPDASVAQNLMDVVNRSDSQEARIPALRAYIRVVSLPSERLAAETLAMLKLAMDKASRADEKKLILSRAPSARCLETLRWVLPFVDDPELARDASLAVVELAHHRELMGPNHKEFTDALNKVSQTCNDREIVDRAKRYAQGL